MCYCIAFVFQSLCVCVCVYVCRLEDNFQEPVLPFHHVSLGIELGLTGLAANDFTQWTISLVPYWGMKNFIGSIIRISSCSERVWKMVQPGFRKGFNHQSLWEYKERLIISSKSPYGQVCKFDKTVWLAREATSGLSVFWNRLNTACSVSVCSLIFPQYPWDLLPSKACTEFSSSFLHFPYVRESF